MNLEEAASKLQDKFEIVQRTPDVGAVAVVKQIIGARERDLQTVQVLIQLLQRLLYVR